MKTYLYPQAISSINPALFVKRFLGTVLAILLSCAAFAQHHNTNKELTWRNPRLESGVAGQDGAKYRFAQVEDHLDALVTIKTRSSQLVTLTSMDLEGTGWDKAWQPQVNYNNGSAPAAAEWWMEFEVEFVDKNSTNAATVNEFALSAIDVDGNGDKIKEFVTLYNLSTYTLESNSLLGAFNVFDLLGGILTLTGKRFDGPTLNYLNIDTAGTAVMTTAQYRNKNKFRVRTGGVASAANGGANRMYSMYFKGFTYSAPLEFSLPLVLLDFNATMNNKKVGLTWTTGKEKALSHFVIERSVNGVDYNEVGMVMASGNSNVKIGYSYADAISSQSKGVLYYRLKMVDADGKIQRSQVRLIRVGEQKENVSVATYPNPVTSELRITLPVNWQNQKISVDLFNSNGQLVKHVVAGKASQTETLNVNDLTTGLYIVKVSNGVETAVQRIVKSK